MQRKPTMIHDRWCVVIDHGNVGGIYRYTVRDACTFGYPQCVLACAATIREAREQLAIEPDVLNWTIRPDERHVEHLATECA